MARARRRHVREAAERPSAACRADARPCALMERALTTLRQLRRTRAHKGRRSQETVDVERVVSDCLYGARTGAVDRLGRRETRPERELTEMSPSRPAGSAPLP
jgi:hypothetical protein